MSKKKSKKKKNNKKIEYIKEPEKKSMKEMFSKENLKKTFTRNTIQTIVIIAAVIVGGYFLTSYTRLHLNEKTSVVVSARSNYRDYIFDNDKYLEGELKPGIYKAFAEKSFGYAQVENNKDKSDNKASLGIVDNSLFNRSGYIEVRKGDTVTLDHCYIIPVDKATSTGPVENVIMGDNTYLVGKDVKAGTYKVVPMTDEDKDASESVTSMVLSKKMKERLREEKKHNLWEVSVWNKLRDGEQVFRKENFKETEVTVKDGEYLELVGCKASLVK